MKQVQLTESIPGYLEGEVLTVDEKSAESLVKVRKVAKEYDPAAKGAKDPVPHPVAPGVVHIQQVVDPTPAAAPEPDPAPAEAPADPKPASK